MAPACKLGLTAHPGTVTALPLPAGHLARFYQPGRLERVCVCGAEPWASPAVGRGEKAPAGVGCDSQQGWTQTKGVSPGA